MVPSAKTPAPPNMRRTTTGPKAANSSRMSSGDTATAQGWRYWCASAAGLSLTDSPQPQAEVWFGLLNTNWAASLSVL
jgi:hypothetical protein